MSGLILRLAGPLQSWGEHSAFTDRDTQRFPTRSGLIGLFAGAYGMRRGEPLERFADLEFTVRVDRPGVPLVDFHTVGGGRTRDRTVPTAEGRRRSLDTATIVTRRHYLSDAVFVVGVSGRAATIDTLAERLAHPRWQPYLGRRSCPPDPPLLVKRVEDVERELTERVPVARRATNDGRLDFVDERASSDQARAELLDVPLSFDRFNRRYRSRTVSITSRPIPDHLWVGRGLAYHDALSAYAGATP